MDYLWSKIIFVYKENIILKYDIIWINFEYNRIKKNKLRVWILYIRYFFIGCVWNRGFLEW